MLSLADSQLNTLSRLQLQERYVNRVSMKNVEKVYLEKLRRTSTSELPRDRNEMCVVIENDNRISLEGAGLNFQSSDDDWKLPNIYYYKSGTFCF